MQQRQTCERKERGSKQKIFLISKLVKPPQLVESVKGVFTLKSEIFLDTQIAAKTLFVKDKKEGQTSKQELLPDGYINFLIKKQYSILDWKLIQLV